MFYTKTAMRFIFPYHDIKKCKRGHPVGKRKHGTLVHIIF